MSESFKKVVERLIDPSRVYQNNFIEEISEEEDQPIKDTKVIAHEEHSTKSHIERRRGSAALSRPSPWEAMDSDEKMKILTDLLGKNKKRKEELLKTKESLDEKSMIEELSTKEVNLFTKVGDELSNLDTHKSNVEKALEKLTDTVGEE